MRLLVVLRAYAKEVSKYAWRYPPKDVLFGLRHGVPADRVHLYGRANILSGRYLGDFERQFTRFINPKPARELLEDKLLFERSMGRFAPVPRNYLYSDNGRLVVLDPEWHDIARCGDPARPRLFVMKRGRGGGGTGVARVEIRAGDVSVNGQNMDMDGFYALFLERDERILCEFIEQCAFCRKIYPETTNTVRVICMRDPDREPFVAAAVLRAGSPSSKGVDNFNQGGFTSPIDLATGVLGPAVHHDRSQLRGATVHDVHPDTGVRISGETLPGWDRAAALSLRLMRQVPFVNYVGWDIVLTEDGPVLLEGNNYTDVRLVQAHGGLLENARIREFYRRHGIIRT